MNIVIYCAHKETKDVTLVENVRKLGEVLAKLHHTLVYGASNVGLMKVISDAFLDNQGEVIGLGCKVYHRAGETYSRLKNVVIYDSIAERRSAMIKKGNLFIALPGGIGTLDEITEVMELKRTNPNFPPILFYNYNHFYDLFKQMLIKLDQDGYLKENDLSLYHFMDSIDDIIYFIKNNINQKTNK